MLQHLKMTNMFEASVQSVDPSVSLPYWDFTIDQAAGTLPYRSYVFTGDVFGSMPQPADMSWGFQSTDSIADAQIPDGRWAGLKADMNELYPELKFAYGYMRAPWNMNPSPYVTRFTSDYQIGISLPSCTQHYDILQTDNLMDFMVSAMSDGCVPFSLHLFWHVRCRCHDSQAAPKYLCTCMLIFRSIWKMDRMPPRTP
jgi:hypothetical protein